MAGTVTCQQGMLNPPWHLIPHLIYPEDCSVCQMPYFKIYISYRTCEIEDCLLFILNHGHNLNYLLKLTCVLKKLQIAHEIKFKMTAYSTYTPREDPG